jgi:hypothetical protein
MQLILSLVSGVGLMVLVYGLSFLPSATLGQLNEVEEATSPVDQEGANPEAEDAGAPDLSLDLAPSERDRL